MELMNQHPQVIAIASAVMIIVENVLPHLPIKANSTLQLIITMAKAILRKKA